jgi:hypothetical protein
VRYEEDELLVGVGVGGGVIVLVDVATLEAELDRDPMSEECDKLLDLLDNVCECSVESLLLDEKLLLVVFTVALQTSLMHVLANKVMIMVSNCIALCLNVGHIPII